VFEILKPVAEWCAAIIEALGIFIITGLAFYALVFAALRLGKGGEPDIIFRQVRQRLGRGILLGLEFLIAADIIRTVAIDLTFRAVQVLAIIVLIRTFLSFTLDLELTGRWPWHREE
jgi:uncharacterized membrane protein